MVFVVGVYNSGTTIVKDAIALHPSVNSAPIEGDQLSGALDSFEKGGWPRGMYGNASRIMGARRHEEVDAELLISDLRPWVKTGEIFLEKSISNSVRIPQLRKAFPGAKFVWVIRNPTDVVNGIKRKSKPGPVASKILGSAGYPADFLLRQWAFFVRLMMMDMKGADDCCVCSYENFLKAPAHELNKVFDFLGVATIRLQENEKGITVGDSQLSLLGNRGAAMDIDLERWVQDQLLELEGSLCPAG
ncbi:MAG: sulfotransferase [Immundisolibacteraceae bacterium]|nr:sulfotransferase [Immundisolibacteraceae bacterium]